MIINKLLTKVNYTRAFNKKNKYIVVHYVGATGGAEANCRYFYSTYRGASAHYFVGHKGEVWQCVEDKNAAWHCGATRYTHPACRNSNSIGVELCCKKDSKGNWYFEKATIEAAITLISWLMAEYNIPATNVLRHYDVCGKICPEPFVRDKNAWWAFLRELQKDGAVAYKTIVEIAKEVIAGKWGNGNTRRKKLTAAGYDYNAVQKKVNELLRQ